DRPRQQIDVLGPNGICEQLATEQRLIGKLAHLDGVLDRVPVTADAGLRRRAGNRDDVEVEIRREATIQPEFLEAVPVAAVERREVEEAQRDRLFDLVREFTCE